MPLVVGVKFKDSGKIYHFSPNGHHVELGDAVVVETVRGLELGKVASPIADMPESDLIAELKPVVRQPTIEDYDRITVLSSRHDEVMRLCTERIAIHKLPMRLVRADWNFDGTRLTVYFTAQQRVDFRHLVRELARIFHARIELRQVGARDEAKLLGGLGPCGRPLCCSTFLPDFARVSVKMAKDQDLPLNPSKISGVCGRLLCCLSYEQDQYLEIKAELPTRGETVITPDGVGMVVAVNTIRETVTVDVEGNYLDFSAAQLKAVAQDVQQVARERAKRGEAAPMVGRAPLNPLNVWDTDEWEFADLKELEDDPPSVKATPVEPREPLPERHPPTPAPRQGSTPAHRQKPNESRLPRSNNEQASQRPSQRPMVSNTTRQQSLGVPEQLNPRGRPNDPDEPRNAPRRRRPHHDQANPEQRPPRSQAQTPRHMHGQTRPTNTPDQAQNRSGASEPPQQPKREPASQADQHPSRRRKKRNGRQ